MTKIKQMGGGSWEEVCYCCGFPMSSTSPDSVEYFDELTEEEKEKMRTELEQTDLSWMDQNIGFDYDKDLVFLLGAYDDYGELSITDEVQSPETEEYLVESGETTFFTGEFVNYEEDITYGIAIHRTCAQILEEAIGRPLVGADGDTLMGYGLRDQDQFFDWGGAFKEFGVDFFKNPLENEEFRRRVLEDSMAGFINEALQEENLEGEENLENNNSGASTLSLGNADEINENNNNIKKPNNKSVKSNKTNNTNKNKPPINNSIYKNFTGGKKRKTQKKKKSRTTKAKK